MLISPLPTQLLLTLLSLTELLTLFFLEDEIFVIPFNRPILHLNSNPEIILPGTQKHQILSQSISDNLMEIKVNDVTGSMTVILNLKNKNVELPSIDKNL